jgi:hypothetical protein
VTNERAVAMPELLRTLGFASGSNLRTYSTSGGMNERFRSSLRSVRGVLPSAHRLALESVCDRLNGSGVAWAVTGSVALAFQAVPVSCGDLDLVTTARGSGELERLLGPEVLEPVLFRRRQRIRGHLGRLRLGEIEIEVLGDVQNLLTDDTRTVPPQLHMHAVHVRLGERVCPVLGLAYLRDAYSAMGRSATVRLIERTLSNARAQTNSE